MIYGNIEGIKKQYINRLEELYELNCEKDILISEDILKIISEISQAINREVAVYINRRGKIVNVLVGDNFTAPLEFMSEKRSERGLNGIRCIHTHLSNDSRLSVPDITALIEMKFDTMVAVAVVDGRPESFSFGYLKVEEGLLKNEAYVEGPYSINELENVQFSDVVGEIEKQIEYTAHEIQKGDKERVILVGCKSEDGYSIEESLDELQELAETAGAIVVHKVMQNKAKIDPAYYIGSGKAKEIALLRQSLMVDTVIFDDELNGVQTRNLEEVIGCKVIDRTTLILDIFAQRAKSMEGKLQVELAQLKYRLPRLIGLGHVLSRTGGGIGTRGPGEKKLEIDKRHIRERIYDLENELERVKKIRSVQRERRKQNEIPVVAFVGYTNVGKSTLRNKLCELYGKDKEKVLEANMLFATLDTTTRIITLPSGRDVLFSDTVGFIRKLPHDLVEAFKSTLEEVVESDLIVHVVDGSNDNAIVQIETVNRVLKEIGAQNKEIILAINKIDLAKEENLYAIKARYQNCVEISALKEINLDLFLKEVEGRIFSKIIKDTILVPYKDARIVSELHSLNCVKNEEYKEEGIEILVEATEDIINRYKKYLQIN
ncbi:MULTISPECIES: GTPase HflX [Caloramator]|uniref:GTPase HflX n=1 Tax=Caloramator proteoclasticus DSM 10124 TaxID=1121262 RepID=A0A1M4Z020_9CLOT|nr:MULTISPECIES: GTPase HflX [Caloramator]SHF11409.1 GTP-binding protein HflX [Caloramator proteoclasticus DSM 10124]